MNLNLGELKSMFKFAYMLHGKKRDKSITMEIGQPIWTHMLLRFTLYASSFIALFCILVLSIEAVIK